MTAVTCVSTTLLVLSVLLGGSSGQAAVPHPPLVESHLVEGRLAEAAKTLTTHLNEHPTDARSQYELGVVRLLQAVEGLAQNLHRYGLKSTSPQLPFVRLPVPPNPNPEKLSYDKWRGVLEQFSDDLDRAAAVLAKVDDPDVKLRLPVGMIRLDLDGDGTAGPDETFWKVFTRVAWRAAKLSNEQRIAAWKRFLDEAEAVLHGDKLLPHWRVKDGRGINLKRVFEEPRTFDLVLWAHGAAAIPYLEEGELVTPETARSLSGAFQGRFLAFAVWFQ
jgi:hypothetical protein